MLKTNLKVYPMKRDKAKAEAEKIIRDYKMYVESDPLMCDLDPDLGTQETLRHNAKLCAIIHVKGILNLHTLEIGKGMMLSGCRNDSLHWKAILAELERK